MITIKKNKNKKLFQDEYIYCNSPRSVQNYTVKKLWSLRGTCVQSNYDSGYLKNLFFKKQINCFTPTGSPPSCPVRSLHSSVCRLVQDIESFEMTLPQGAHTTQQSNWGSDVALNIFTLHVAAQREIWKQGGGGGGGDVK